MTYSLKSQDILDVAEALMNIQSEAAYRSAISRSYYAMFHAVLEALESNPPSSQNHHAALIQYLQNADREPNEKLSARTRKRLSIFLRQERFNRNRADYELSRRMSNKEAEQSFLTATRFMSLCKNEINKQ
ncbi:hypothetical protein ACFX4S_14260 [Kosakonia sp. YIM B13605]|uniref:hypothetical protein n=1 Tax=Kosakonia TaxID=1330547 RepID=UPI0032D91DBE